LKLMAALDQQIESAVHSLMDDYRERCLWFLRTDYRPHSPEEILRVLRWIRARGDREAFSRAKEIESWLSQRSSGTSAAS
jgi:hypothetical protein